MSENKLAPVFILSLAVQSRGALPPIENVSDAAVAATALVLMSDIQAAHVAHYPDGRVRTFINKSFDDSVFSDFAVQEEAPK